MLWESVLDLDTDCEGPQMAWKESEHEINLFVAEFTALSDAGTVDPATLQLRIIGERDGSGVKYLIHALYDYDLGNPDYATWHLVSAERGSADDTLNADNVPTSAIILPFGILEGTDVRRLFLAIWST